MQAIIKQPATAPRQTRHGMRIFIIAEIAGGHEIRIESDPGDTALTSLRRGQKVEVFKNLRGEYILGQDIAPPAQKPAANAEPLTFRQPSGQLQENMLEFVRWQARFYQDCRDEVAANVKNGTDTDEVARTIFQNAVRKYRLQ